MKTTNRNIKHIESKGFEVIKEIETVYSSTGKKGKKITLLATNKEGQGFRISGFSSIENIDIVIEYVTKARG